MRLPVPSNINIRREIWRGLTYPDFFKVLCAGIVSVLCAVAYVKLINPAHQIWATFGAVLVTVMAFLFFQRLDNFSPYEVIKISLSYGRQQQQYLFKRSEPKK